MYSPLPERFVWESNSTATDGKQCPDIETHSAQPGLPDENFNKKPNNAKQRGQTDCLKARKKPNFICSLAIPLSQKTSKLQEHQNFLLEIKNKSCLALYWSTDLFWLFMVHEIAHLVKWCHCLHTYPSAAFCTKVSPIHSYSYNQNHKEHFCFGVIIAFLSRRRRPVCKHWDCLVLTTQLALHGAVSAHISSDYAKTLFGI